MNVVIGSLHGKGTYDPRVVTDLSWASSEADALQESAVTCPTITSLNLAFLVVICKSNSDTGTNTLSQWNKQNSRSSLVHLLCIPNKFLLLFGGKWTNKQTTFFPKLVESLSHLSGLILVLKAKGCLGCSGSCHCAAGVRTMTKLLHCTNSLSQKFCQKKVLCPYLFADRSGGNMDRVSFS